MTLLLVSTSASDAGFISSLCSDLARSKLKFNVLLTGQHSSNSKTNNSFTSLFYNNTIVMPYIIQYTLKSYMLDSDESFSVVSDIHTVLRTEHFTSVLFFGDRYEMLLAATIASQYSDLTLIHYGAGQVSTGSADDLYRKCISTLCSRFIVSTPNSLENLKTLKGNNSCYITCVSGSLGLDRINSFNKESIKVIEGRMLISLHPQSHANDLLLDALKYSLEGAFNIYGSSLDVRVSRVNNDISGISFEHSINSLLRQIDCEFTFLDNISDIDYLTNMCEAEFLIGNSSSFVIEAPSLRRSTVLLGNRQDGRESAKCVFKAGLSARRIKRCLLLSSKINKADTSSDCHFSNPYWQGGASSLIISFLQELN